MPILQNLRHMEFVILSFLAAAALISYPIQKSIEISRYQHYSLGIIVVGIGYLLQAVWSWRRVSWWGRLALGGMSAYIVGFGALFYFNPWLESSLSLQTQAQQMQRQQWAILFAILGVQVGMFFVRWSSEERAKRRAKKLADQAISETSAEKSIERDRA